MMGFTIDDICMYLIGDDQNIMHHTYLYHSLQLLLTPYSSCRIVRGTEQKKCCIFCFLLKILKINMISSVLIDQSIVKQCSVPMFHRRSKRWIKRCLDKYPVTLFAIGFNSKIDRRHNTVTRYDPLLFYLPVKTLVHPFSNSIIISLGIDRITVNRMCCSFLHRCLYTLR